MPKPNYGFQKRQKELAKLQKREEKAQRRKERNAADSLPPQETSPLPDEPSSDQA